MKSLEEIKEILSEHKEEIREKYGVVILGVFGSYARGEQKETSDVDILIEIERPIGLKFFELWDELEKLLGCEVDLVREKLLREEIKSDILKEVERV
ncbi:MAG: DNA polymerase beta domain protein region [Thermotoga petrophila]|uniref:DNA polymerase beta domain protein region n=1 Tax=Thermotoga petrophila TaxID=93929 RepID=A0A101ESB9_9THEM|nr:MULTISPECIES: nucleotidyltransferase family protein [Pseudothermotoga]KUK23762.1 MAG: DNA polymerase beta domain protein region [Thermotoga petrophila]MBC7121834.1 nucleotidyltransferase family protein [Pseudothermotoga sp.]MDI6863264.1 nucleotidyltransferase family protein [Pseudothermotoga sp.]